MQFHSVDNVISSLVEFSQLIPTMTPEVVSKSLLDLSTIKFTSDPFKKSLVEGIAFSHIFNSINEYLALYEASSFPELEGVTIKLSMSVLGNDRNGIFVAQLNFEAQDSIGARDLAPDVYCSMLLMFMQAIRAIVNSAPDSVVDALDLAYKTQTSIQSVAILMDKFDSMVSNRISDVEISLSNKALMQAACAFSPEFNARAQAFA